MTALAARLTAELRAVGHRLHGTWDVARDGVDDEIAAAVLGEQRELSAQTRALLVHRQALLVAAQARLQAGRYGECLACGEPIAAGRLLAIPEAALCGRCQATAEREAAGADSEPIGVRRVARPTRPIGARDFGGRE